MQGTLYEESSVWLFVLVTVLMGGWAAWMTGRAMAITWQPYVVCVGYLLLLAGAVRFIHYALFGGTLLSAQYYVVDSLVLLVLGSIGFRHTRARQMVRQYRWRYERLGLLRWRDKHPS